MFAPFAFREPGPKCKPQEIKFLLWVVSPPVVILAVDNFRFLRMKFQAALLEAFF